MNYTIRKTIDVIKSKWPADWKWQSKARCWTSSIGEVRYCAALHPQYDGDDDTFVTELWFYPKDGTPERVW